MLASHETSAAQANALEGSLKDFRSPKGPDLIGRLDRFFEWQDARRSEGLWPYARSLKAAPLARSSATTDDGNEKQGANFASQDYLSLSSHPAVKEAAKEAVDRFGVHSAGSGALLGNTSLSVELAHRISEFSGFGETVLYPTGWGAGYAAIQGFVRPDDHVVIDMLAHSCLTAGAAASTQKVQFNRHLDLNSIEKRLSRIRETDAANGILVVTESLFSMHSVTPDIMALRALCDRYGAKLLVDCAHDFGAMGEDGRGFIAAQGAVDAADVIIGSFSKTFASNGGFVCVKTRAAAEYLKYFSATHTYSNMLSPVQAAVVLTTLGIVASEEGAALRRRLMDNVLDLRSSMAAAGHEVLGEPSAIVPVKVGDDALGRIMSRELPECGGIANLVEYPAVPMGQTRFRFQVMAAHTREDVRDVVTAFGTAMERSRAIIARGRTE